MKYCNKQELNQAIALYQINKELTPRLYVMISRVIEGVISKYGRNNHDDAFQNCWMVFLTKYWGIDCSKDSFNYLTTCFINSIRATHRDRWKFLSLTDVPSCRFQLGLSLEK
jgi:hypothetical protein